MGGGGGGRMAASDPISAGEASADYSGAIGQATADGANWAAPGVQGYGGIGGTVAPHSVYTQGAGVQTGIPQGGMGSIPGYDAQLYIPGGYASPGIASYFMGGGQPGGNISYDAGQHDPWLGEVAAGTQEGVQAFEQQVADNEAAAATANELPAGYDPSTSALSPAEYQEQLDTIANEFDSIDTYDPTMTFEEQLSPEEYAEWQEMPTSNPAAMAADTLYMNTTADVGGHHIGNTLAPNLFGEGASFENPGESGTYGGSLVTGGNDVAGSGLGAAVGSLVNNSLLGTIAGTDLPEYATAEDMINAETAAWESHAPDTPIELTEYTGPTINNNDNEPSLSHDEIIAMHHPAFDTTPAESAAAAGFDMNDPSTWRAPDDDGGSDDGGGGGGGGGK